MIPQTFPTISEDFQYDDSSDDFARTLGIQCDEYVSSGEADNGGANFIGQLSDDEMIALSLIDAISMSHTVTGWGSTRTDHYASCRWVPETRPLWAIDAWNSSGFHVLELYCSEAEYQAAVAEWQTWEESYYDEADA